MKKLTLRFAGVCTVSWQEQEHVGDYDNTKIYSSTIHMFQNVENVICEYLAIVVMCKCCTSGAQAGYKLVKKTLPQDL